MERITQLYFLSNNDETRNYTKHFKTKGKGIKKGVAKKPRELILSQIWIANVAECSARKLVNSFIQSREFVNQWSVNRRSSTVLVTLLYMYFLTT